MARARNQKKRYRKRRGLRLLYLLLSFFLIIAAIFASCLFFFRVENIEISGNMRYSNEQILNAANIPPNANLFLLPRGQIAARIKAEMPYAKEVKLCPQLPTTLLLEIEESIPVAAVRSDATCWLIDANAKVLEQVEESMATSYANIEGLTPLHPAVGEILRAPEEESRRFLAMKSLLRALKEQEVSAEVSWIDLRSPVEIEMSYGGRFTVKLPIRAEGGLSEQGSDSYGLKIEALKKIVENLNQTDRGIIDLTDQDASFRPR